jgi:subfamily B ATP-binding cassette protein MsbA
MVRPVTESKRQEPIGVFYGLKRVLRYGKAYWKIILLTVFCMGLYAVSVNGRAYLIKPLLEQVIIPAAEMQKVPGLGALDLTKLKAEVPEEQLQEEREQLTALLEKRLAVLIAVAFAVVAMIPLMSYVTGYASSYVVTRMVRDLQCDLCDKFLQMPLAYHTRARKGEIFARLNSDVSRSAMTFRLLFGELIQESLTLLVGVGAMIYLNWQITVLMTLVMPPMVLLVVRFGRKVRKKSLKRQEKVGDQMGSMLQMFSGIKVVKAFRMEETESQRFREVNDELFRREMKVVKTQEMSKSITELFNNITYILFMGIGIYAIMKAMLGLTLPVLVAFLGLATTLYRPIKNLSRAYNSISDSMAGIERVTEILDLEPERPEQQGSEILREIRDGIRFEGVSFSYDGEHPVLEHIDLDIGKGQTVALVGKTGVGKTTLSDLIPRFYDPTQGRIVVDGLDIRAFSRDSLLRHIAVVTQEPFLFDTSVEENIRYGRPDATEAEIIEAARAAYIHDRIVALPQGYQTRVGDRGARLSGGERQRITIARAMLRNPSILILDEATSSLDAESEQWVKKAIDNLMKGRTTVAIAHRLSTIRNADKIVVLENGRISMIGRHEELLRREGLYRELCALQFERDETDPVANSRSAQS